jgi:hypothetical protein
MNNEPFRECPRFDRCSVNSCPLDPDQDLHTVHKLDKEQKCPMEKGVRVRIGSKYPDLLPRLGLTSLEWAAKQRMSKLSTAEKLKAIERLSAHQFKPNADKPPL